MALWTKSADNEDVTLKVGHDFRAHMKTKTSMSYMPHYSEGKGKDGKSKDRNKYTL